MPDNTKGMNYFMSTRLDYYLRNTDKFPFPGFFQGVNETWQALEKATQMLNEMFAKANVKEMRGSFMGNEPSFYGNYFVDEGTEIYNDVTIIGPVYIGKNCEIMPGAVIRPNTIIGDGCSIGHGSEVKHSILMDGSKVASLAFVGDSILGVSARIGSGVITANRKFNQSNVTVKIAGRPVDLRSGFFGCVLGDAARIGANSVTQPGTHIGPHTWIFPITNVRGFIPEAKRVFSKQELVYENNEIIELKP